MRDLPPTDPDYGTPQRVEERETGQGKARKERRAEAGKANEEAQQGYLQNVQSPRGGAAGRASST